MANFNFEKLMQDAVESANNDPNSTLRTLIETEANGELSPRELLTGEIMLAISEFFEKNGISTNAEKEKFMQFKSANAELSVMAMTIGSALTEPDGVMDSFRKSIINCSKELNEIMSSGKVDRDRLLSVISYLISSSVSISLVLEAQLFDIVETSMLCSLYNELILNGKAEQFDIPDHIIERLSNYTDIPNRSKDGVVLKKLDKLNSIVTRKKK